MTEQEFAAIRKQWRETRTLDTDQRIDSLIRAVEERDAIIHDLMVDASTLSRRAVEEFAAGLVDKLVEERKRIAQNPVVSGWSAIYYAIEMIKKIVGDVTPDPLPPDQVRQESERLRERLREIRCRVEDYLDTLGNCGGKWSGVEAALNRLREMASEEAS